LESNGAKQPASGRSKSRLLTRKRLLVAVPSALLALYLLSARYYDDGAGVYSVTRAPFLSISFGPAYRFIVASGLNAVSDQGVGVPGNVLEFSIAPHTRLALRFFSVRWLRLEVRAFWADHRRLSHWFGAQCRRTTPAAPPAQGAGSEPRTHCA
jgi:hypothetical protein